jgi:putative ABC transport system permease protein
MGFEVLKVAFGALVGHRFRTVLTMLSIIIGAFAIVLMVSLARSGLATLDHGIQELGGARIVMIGSQPPQRALGKSTLFDLGFSLHDYENITKGIPHLVERTMFYVGRDYLDMTSDTGRHGRTDLVGADHRFFETFRLDLQNGRAFGEEDDKRHAPVCVVGQTVSDALWSGNPVGHMLTIGDLRCRVIGRLAKVERWGVGFGWDWDDVVVAPLETVADSVQNVHQSANVLLKTDDPANNDIVKRIVNARMMERHSGVDDFLIFDFATAMKKFDAMFLMMEVIVGVLSGIALLIGGVGVMNMLLVSVTERIGEIGVRKALGARPADIGLQFFLEAVLLAGLGGATGACIGLAAAGGASALVHKAVASWQGHISYGAAFLAVTVSVMIGAGFGYVPARRAARLDPVLCMRR